MIYRDNAGILHLVCYSVNWKWWGWTTCLFKIFICQSPIPFYDAGSVSLLFSQLFIPPFLAFFPVYFHPRNLPFNSCICNLRGEGQVLQGADWQDFEITYCCLNLSQVRSHFFMEIYTWRATLKLNHLTIYWHKFHRPRQQYKIFRTLGPMKQKKPNKIKWKIIKP